MVPCEEILRKAVEEEADVIGLSGLVTPSLDEMVHVAREMHRLEMTLPLLIGGATTSAKHTAVKIAPAYEHPVVHVKDASRGAPVVDRLMHPQKRKQFDEENRREQGRLVEAFQNRRNDNLVSYREALAGRFTTDWSNQPIAAPSFTGTRVLDDYPLSELREYIDWSPLFWAWEMRGKYPKILEHPKYGDEAKKLFRDAGKLLDEVIEKKLLRARGVYGFWPAASVDDDILVFGDSEPRREIARLYNLRQQWVRKGQPRFYSLADYVAPLDSGRDDYIGAFAVTGGVGAAEMAARFEADHDDYNAIMVKVLAERIAEAFAERLHEIARNEWGFGSAENLSVEEMQAERFRGIRPAPGYPCCPDHTEKRTLFQLLDAEASVGISLTETWMMMPEASVSGYYFSHPESRYFTVDRLTRDQVEDYSRRKGMPLEEVEHWLRPYLAYDA
jgi:5-methyltetrahydrofolate--homocysteine methyltransferase